MASSTHPVKQEHPTVDSSIIVKQEHPTDDSSVTVKQEHPTGDSSITVKQEHPTDDSSIVIKVKDLNNRVYNFQVKGDTRMQKLRMIWKDLEGMADYETVVFMLDGQRIKYDKKTVNDVGLKDGDCIIALRGLTGD